MSGFQGNKDPATAALFHPIKGISTMEAEC